MSMDIDDTIGASNSRLLDLIAQALGYVGDQGYVKNDAFGQQPNHRHALRLADKRMGVRAAFGLWTGRAGALSAPNHPRFTPLVFLASASDEAEAKEIHRRVWSQGLVPHLIIATDHDVWVCEGFAFSSSHWDRHAVRIAVEGRSSSARLTARLGGLTAKSLRSSVAWRDEARSGDDFVDERLLKSLAELSQIFSVSKKGRVPIAPAATNALIARLLYFYFLVDRGFVTPERLSEWDVADIQIGHGQDKDWPLDATQRLFQRLDEVFNGSIFPMRPEHASGLEAGHINDIRRVLRGGGQLYPNGELQLGFLDYDFASIRTETLSAIYEMFLHNEEADAGRRLGAFYTPPFLADYLLDRLEDERPLLPGVRVLDPAAGSGVFLVGAYRRIVEASLAAGKTQLPLRDLHDLMTTSIFGVELNDTACHVAAFSLYLTMLDYTDPREAADYTAWPVVTGRARLFPPMLTALAGRPANIRTGDFFSGVADHLPCDVVVGNPPWVQTPKLDSSFALDYERKHRLDAPIGDRQAAELFTWKALREHLADGGALSFLMPLKSLVNSLSGRFTTALRAECEIAGVADFAHLRYILFRRSSARPAAAPTAKPAARSARHSTAGIVLRKGKPKEGHRFWSFRPLRPTQPATRKGRLWILIHDWTQVQWHLQSDMNESNWLQVFTCSAVDRKILRNIGRQIERGRMTTLGRLQSEVGLEFRIEVDKNIDRAYVLGTDVRSDNYWLAQLGLSGDALEIAGEHKAVPLPREQIDLAIPSVRGFLQGNVVVMARNCEQAVFVESPAAFSFLILACFPGLAGRALPSSHRQFLEALTAYMSTDVFRYLCFVSSRRMMIDRASIELSTVREIPWPLGKPGEPGIAKFLAASGEEREGLVFDAFNMPSAYRAAVSEFGNFREEFRDGGSPREALDAVETDDLLGYMEMLLVEIDGGKNRYQVSIAPVPASDLTAVVVTYVGDGPPANTVEAVIEAAVADYHLHGASGLAQSRYLWHSRLDMQTVLLKPNERLHWSRDRAFADADLVTAAIMSRFAGQVAA